MTGSSAFSTKVLIPFSSAAKMYDTQSEGRERAGSDSSDRLIAETMAPAGPMGR